MSECPSPTCETALLSTWVEEGTVRTKEGVRKNKIAQRFSLSPKPMPWIWGILALTFFLPWVLLRLEFRPALIFVRENDLRFLAKAIWLYGDKASFILIIPTIIETWRLPGWKWKQAKWNRSRYCKTHDRVYTF